MNKGCIRLLFLFGLSAEARRSSSKALERIYQGQIDPPESKTFPYHLQIAEVEESGKVVDIVCGATLISLQ